MAIFMKPHLRKLILFRGIFLGGHSAGSQICAMILGSEWFGKLLPDEKNLFKGVFHLSGIFHLEPLLETSINDALKMDEEEAKKMSPMLHVEKLAKNLEAQMKDFVVSVIIAENDSPSFRSQGADYCQKVRGFLLRRTFVVIEKVL